MCNFERGILNVTRLWFLVKSSILAVKLFSFRMYILAYILAHFCQPSLQSLCNASAVVILPTPLLSYPNAELYPTFREGELLQYTLVIAGWGRKQDAATASSGEG